ncbi:MTAP family purine nucleoside phosphorylase [Patescibacteria group bacterium]|nr:MTAP family purine nucleoside phosphorylase [Patescibacteria group bacterium]
MITQVQSGVGVIGGSGLDDLPGIELVATIYPETIGNQLQIVAPDEPIKIFKLNDGTDFAFIGRHKKGHIRNPSRVKYRENILGLKAVGVTKFLHVSACGILAAQVEEGTLAVPDDLFDSTKGVRPRTFFAEAAVHIGMEQPFCPHLMPIVHNTIGTADIPTSLGGTYNIIEGPQFSTPAESRDFISRGFCYNGMTLMPEVPLAHEACGCSVAVLICTDYDVGHKKHKPVSVEVVKAALKRYIGRLQLVLPNIVVAMAAYDRTKCNCASALDNAVQTEEEFLGESTMRLLALCKK